MTPLRYRHTAEELESKLDGMASAGLLEPFCAHLVLAAAATTQGRAETVGAVLGLVLTRGTPPGPVREAILQSYLFVGYPRVINALAALRGISGEPPGAVPIDLRLEADLPGSWETQGPALCRRIYGDRYEKLLAAMANLSPDLPRWMVLEGYGKVLSRPHLDTKTRELVAVGSLVPLQVPEQLRAHARGALHVGATEAEVREAIRVAAFICPRELSSAEAVLERVRKEMETEKS